VRPQLQRYRMQADGAEGDCYRTCLAMVLDLDRDEVPHFCADVPPGTAVTDPLHIESVRIEREWLAARGLALVNVAFSPELKAQEIADQLHNHSPSVAAILVCSYKGVNHALAMYGGVIYDPLGDLAHDSYEPAIDGLWWMIVPTLATKPLPSEATPASVASTQED